MDTYLPSDFHLLHDDAIADWRDLPAERVNSSESQRFASGRCISESPSDAISSDRIGSDWISSYRISGDSLRDIELNVDPTWLAI
jgi:hypothetical protein